MRKFAGPFLSRLNWYLIPAALTCASLLWLTSGVGVAASSQPTVSPRVKRGDALFHQRCVMCHNKQPGDAAPFGPPNLYDAFRQKLVTPAAATNIIRHGKGQMPSFAAILTSSQIQDVIAYLQAQPGPKQPN